MTNGSDRAANASGSADASVLPLVDELLQIQDARLEERLIRFARKGNYRKFESTFKMVLGAILLSAAGIFLLIWFHFQWSLWCLPLMFVGLVILGMYATPYSLSISSRIVDGPRQPYADLRPLDQRAGEVTDEMVGILTQGQPDEASPQPVDSTAYASRQGRYCPVCQHQAQLPFSCFGGERHRQEERGPKSYAQWGLLACPGCHALWEDEFALTGISTYLRMDGTRGFLSNHEHQECASDVCKKCGSLHVRHSAQPPEPSLDGKTTFSITMTCEDCDSFEARFFELSGCTVLWRPGSPSTVTIQDAAASG